MVRLKVRVSGIYLTVAFPARVQLEFAVTVDLGGGEASRLEVGDVFLIVGIRVNDVVNGKDT
eukprot:6028855-Ditylum_brightwellii.AAC.1